MQHEFDNTFESLLRRAAARSAGEVLPENDAHLDADSISAFAENALPDATRAHSAAHLADCSDCRQILVNFSSIQEAEESEIVETKAASAVHSTWSERFAGWFALPTLGYAAAALVVLFVGVFAFVALQSRQEKQAPQVAQAEVELEDKEERRRSTRAQIAQPEPTVENTPEAQPTETPSEADLNASILNENSNRTEEESPNRGLPPSVVITRGQANAVEATNRRDPEPQRDSNRVANTSNTAPGSNANTLVTQQTSTVNSNSASGSTAAGAPPPNPIVKPKAEKKEPDQEQAQIADATPLETRNNQARSVAVPEKQAIRTRSVGGRNFQNLDGVWRDSAYDGQATVNVSRGSDEYKKLDGGLRSIADSFRSATVIIVWQGKAYRIL